MKRVLPAFILLLLLFSCTKKEKNNILWEKSFGPGDALFVRSAPDSGFFACGELAGKPYFIRSDRSGNRIIELKPELNGLFSASWFDTTGYINVGSSDGKMLLMRHNSNGLPSWEKTLDPGYAVDLTRLFYKGDDDFLAIGSPYPDSLRSDAKGLYFVWFDTTGQILETRKIETMGLMAAGNAALDEDGNIYLALTRKSEGMRSVGSVAKYNSQLDLLWEKELFNNPGFASACLDIIADESGNTIVSGQTEAPVNGSNISNSFVVSLNSGGEYSEGWEKKYTEYYNQGSALTLDGEGDIIMLNRKCFILNLLSRADGADAGTVRTFSVCDPKESDALGQDMDLNYNGNLLLAGSLGGNFYLALKPLQ